MIWLGTMPGGAAANRFGEPPARGFGLTRPKKVTPAWPGWPRLMLTI